MEKHNKNADRTNLLLVRSGRDSLHPTWNKNSNKEKNFDIFALAYGTEKDIFPDGSHDNFFYCPGSKSTGYHDWLSKNERIFEKYNYIALFDDDIDTSHEDISRLFEYCEALDISLAQPALTPNSHYSLMITRQHKSFLHRWTNWVEIMAPIFKSELLANCVETFALNPYGGGIIESLWPRYCKTSIGEIAIIDKIPITHTREIGSAGTGIEGNTDHKLKYNARRIVEIQECFKASVDNLCGVTTKGEFVHLGEQNFLQLLASDIDDAGLKNHPKLDSKGGLVSTNNLCISYLNNAHTNLEAVNHCAPSKKFVEGLTSTSLKAATSLKKLSTI